MTTKEKRYLIVVIFVAILGGIIFYFGGKATLEAKQKEKQRNLAYCLLSKNIVLYGDSESSPTEQQKEIFGDAFEYINYVECNELDDWSEECKEKNINDVPTWMFPKRLKIENFLLSCDECQKNSKGLYCNDYCFEISDDGEEFYVIGVIDLQTLSRFSDCQIDK
ncbi:MAG: hypothetical protein WBJ22_02870 [Minisyncoccales bacterium]|jgi:hypothetical protein